MESTNRSGFLDRIESGMKAVAALGLVGMAFITGADVLGRGALNTPILGTEEIVTILAVIVAGFSLPYAHSQGSHIGVEMLYNKLGRRLRICIKFVTDLFGSVLFGVVAWQMALYAITLQESGEVSMNLELPTYYVVFALAFCFAVFALCLLRDALKVISKRSA